SAMERAETPGAEAPCCEAPTLASRLPLPSQRAMRPEVTRQFRNRIGSPRRALTEPPRSASPAAPEARWTWAKRKATRVRDDRELESPGTSAGVTVRSEPA